MRMLTVPSAMYSTPVTDKHVRPVDETISEGVNVRVTSRRDRQGGNKIDAHSHTGPFLQ